MVETAAGFDVERFFQLARQIGHGRALGMEFVAAGPDWTELRLPWRAELVGAPATGVLATGAVVSLIDTASGCAVWTSLGRFEPIVTIDLRIDYLRPAVKGETVFARCECVKLTRQVAFVRGVAHGGDPARPIAYSSGTFMLRA
ncbi:PaaI family thioesterase [Sphingomonas sp.]|uniref:PaaI family thioesterase n=1 Tax=Sphingomonas sp. TaxID=28214 RepID=UPI00286DA1DD|nr:PaaI family thioesterase [Sphingomonas sp.]